ncbi:MAG: rhodanese-like domain-containing protein [Bacteroidota bacterium]
MIKYLLILTVVLTTALTVNAQTSPKPLATLNKYPWTENDLLAPEVLAADIKNGKTPLIYNIGVVEDIKGARNIGAASHAEAIDKLKAEVVKLPKHTTLIIYCGCCPFTRCPNAQPAFNTLKGLGFTNVKLLNLPENLKTNWISKGFPLAK